MGKYSQKPQKRKGGSSSKILPIVLAVLLVAVAGIAVFVMMNYHIVSWKLYPKDAAALDLRGKQIDTDHYDKIREKMPDCDIRWNIPFQGGVVADDAEGITISSLSQQDVETLGYAWNLKAVEAQGCTDYEALELLRQSRPEVAVNYSVALSGGSFQWNAESLELETVCQEDIALLRYLPNLKTVILTGSGSDSSSVEALKASIHSAGQEFGIRIAGTVYQDTEENVQISEITDTELDLLQYIGSMKTLVLQNPKAVPENIFSLNEKLPGVTVSWEVTVADKTFDSQTTAVDLKMVEVKDLADVEQKMAYLPNLETVTFGICGIDEPKWENSKSELAASPIENEDMAAYRDRVRGDYKVAWTVRLGPSIALQTDSDNFMPNHFRVGILPDSYAYNLRYCEDMVSLDVGHMTLTDISFVEFMPKLKYLILAWTEVQYIEPIRSCKNLVFLELDNSCIRDISPLVDCTALEDLNLGNTYASVQPILGMDWLKNVYMIGRPDAGIVGTAIRTARVVGSMDPAAATVGYGWRRLPNYYAMRDYLHAPYMN